MADYTKHSIPDLRTLIIEAQSALDKKVDARKAELQAELDALSGTAPKKQGASKGIPIKALYRSPDGKQSYSGRGAIPKWMRDLGVKDRAGMEAYKIK